jgi:hypothetical protein
VESDRINPPSAGRLRLQLKVAIRIAGVTGRDAPAAGRMPAASSNHARAMLRS